MEIFIFIFWIVSALFCSLVAYEKGYSNVAWFFGGIVFGFIALIAVAGLPDKRLRNYLRQIGEKQNAIEPEGRGKEWEPTPSDWADDKK
tara:strand:+ start:200 stop:466 length:267 start_codon:yes stop_codon:yes gene_type:complete